MPEEFELVDQICERWRRDLKMRDPERRLRSMSPAALRARARRARARNGVERVLRLEVPTKRLVAAMRACADATHRNIGPLDTREEIEAELLTIVQEFMDRWLRRKIPHA